MKDPLLSTNYNDFDISYYLYLLRFPLFQSGNTRGLRMLFARPYWKNS